jgi:hypothetical protein
VILEGIIVSKETGLSASFNGVVQPYVLCVVARADYPDVHWEARIVGQSDIPLGPGDHIKVRVLRTITDRKEGVVRHDVELIAE